MKKIYRTIKKIIYRIFFGIEIEYIELDYQEHER